MTVTQPASPGDAAAHPTNFEDPLVRQVFDHLSAEFSGRVNCDDITAAVRQAHDRLQEARIMTYVPILLERFAREVLRPAIAVYEAT